MGYFSSISARRSARVTTILLFAVAAASLAFVASGMPLLRQDWFPIVPSLRFAIDNVTGWDPTGMGSVVGYPASFLLIIARCALAALAGAYVAHVIYFVAYAVLLTFGAARLAGVLGGSPLGKVAAALFAAFNPWVYTELVAGHGFTLLSYAATFWLIAECCDRRRSVLRLVSLAIVVAPQIQFLIVDAAFYALLAVRMQSSVVALAIGSMLLPVFVGIVASRDVLVGIPITLEWERGQSIDPFRATVLRGYFTGYDTVLAPFYEWSQWLIVALSCVGVVTILALHRRRAWLIAFATVPLLASFGTIGPFGGFFAWVITHVSEAALFRELYGLLGFVAVGYVAFCAIGSARWRPLEALWFAAGVAMLVAWAAAPPQQYWVASQSLPRAEIRSQPNSRFLLVPALYPVRFETRGSGTDPDLYPRFSNETPANEAIPMYPLSPAIGRYMRDDDTRGLAGLSVSNIVARPWLDTDPTIRFQLPLPLPNWMSARAPQSSSITDYTPELTVGAFPAIGTLDSNVGAGNVLFSDARLLRGASVPPAWRSFESVRSIRSDNVFVNAADGWVDARLGFVEDPELAQPYGGVLTTQSGVAFSLGPEPYALVFTDGALVARDGSIVVARTHGYRWVFLPAAVRSVRCLGLCVIAAQVSQTPAAPLNPAARSSEALAFDAPVPWFVRAELPTAASPLLRYNVTFDPKWIAIVGGSILPHVRIDGAVNGWLLPTLSSPETVYLIETGAALTTLSEIVAIVATCSLLAYAFRKRTTRRTRSMEESASSERAI
jgi:hypothetical protein